MSDNQPTKKPSWSLDVKLISHLSDLLDQASDFAIQMENGDGGSYRMLKSLLYEVYLRLGGDFDHSGNMLEKDTKEQLKKAFEELETIELELQGNTQMPLKKFILIKNILRIVRGLLYVEQNRLFIKFVTIWSPSEKADRYSQGRAAVFGEDEEI